MSTPAPASNRGTNLAVGITLIVIGFIMALVMSIIGLMSVMAFDNGSTAIAEFGCYFTMMGPPAAWLVGSTWTIIAMIRGTRAWLVSIYMVGAEIACFILGMVLIATKFA